MVLGKQSRNYVDASKVVVGEIDTSSPFESVKHAVSLFGAVAFTRKRAQLSGRKPRTQSSEKLSATESRLHLAQTELNKMKENLHKTDVTRSFALVELEKAKKTIEELNRELSVVSKSKEVVLSRIENVQEKSSSKTFDRTLSSCRHELDTYTVKYLAVALELDEAKKGLGKLRQDYDSAFRCYNTILKQSLEAEGASKANNDASIELSQRISEIKLIVEQANLACEQAEEEKLKIEASRENLRHEYKIKLDASTKTLESLKKELGPDTGRIVQKQLEITYNHSEVLKQDVNKAKDSYSARMLALEIVNEKATLQNLLDEESSLRKLIESLMLELENMKKELLGMAVKEAEAKYLAQELEAELQKNKLVLEKCMTEESKVRNNCDKLKETLVDHLTETQRARQEAKNITSEIEALMKEAEADLNLINEYEAKLQLLLQEIEACRSAEAEALERVKLLSESKDCRAKVTLSSEEFNSLSVKINDSAKLADVKVSVAMVQAEVVQAFQNDNQEMLEGSLKELEELKIATAEALEMAEKAEADKIKLEGELERLDQCFLNKAEGVPRSKTQCEIEMEQPLSYPNGISKSYSTSSANRRRVTLGDILKMDREGREKGRRAYMRSLSGIFRGT